MQRQGFSPRSIEYFERDFLDQYGESVKASDLNIENVGDIELLHLRSLPRFWRENEKGSESIQQVLENLVSGFYESSLPLVYTLFGGNSIEASYGTYSYSGESLSGKREILENSIRSSFHGIELEKRDSTYLQEKLVNLNHVGLLTGTPSETVLINRVISSDIDRLIRGLYGRNCGLVVVGKPLDKPEINALFSMALNEIRIIMDSEKQIGLENPTVRQYKALLEKYLEKLQTSKSQGLWVSSVYMYADTLENLNQLKALTKSAFGGRNSVPDRIRTHMVSNGKPYPGIITNQPPPAPGQYKWPYMYSSIVISSDLASLIKLPSQEHPGYRVKPYVRYNLSQEGRKGVSIGKILDQGTDIGKTYQVPLKGLMKHGLIVGGTGSGKTNTLFYIIRELLSQEIPFLVLEPAKTEYRKLIYDEKFRDKLQVFTLGNNNISPFRLNPFTVPIGMPVQTHLDLLKSVFNASFYMWGPLPHLLEQCLYEIYKDKGWDLASNENMRGSDINAYPTLTDLYQKVDEVVVRIGYSPETTMELQSSLKTRLNSLRIGGKGLMLDTKTNIDFEKLLSKPTVLELETLGDDEEKSFLMGLILTMMYEYYISKGIDETGSLKHITVIEEAHRLLGNTGKTEAYTGDMRGKAVETFTNILSEIRAYGEGVIIAEQIPTKLSSDVVKNTNLKVMHRVVSEDDRRVMAASMNISEVDARIVSTLNVGEAVVYSEGDDGAYHVKVPYAKLGEVKTGDDVAVIRQKMREYLDDPSYLSPYKSCPDNCTNICRYKDIGDRITQSQGYIQTYPRLLLSIIEQVDYQDPLIKMMEAGNDEAMKAGDPYGVKICAAVQSTENYFEYLGRTYNWTYQEQENILTSFQRIYSNTLKNYLISQEIKLDFEEINKFSEFFKKAVEGKQPFSYCAAICSDSTCVYRHLLTGQLNEYYHNRYIEAINNGGPELWDNLKNICNEAVSELNPSLSPESHRRVSNCYALHITNGLENFTPRHVEQVMRNILE